MKKVLFVATVVRKHINVFHLPFLKMFQDKGYRTYVAASNDTNYKNVSIQYCDEYVEIEFQRNPLHLKNISAYFKLKKIIESNQFDIIHCHTPVGGLLGRLAARRARKKGTRVFYTAHGFHFYDGAPLKNWLFYYPVEKFCSRFTDVLITINKEDYALAQKKMRAKRIEYVPGVGIDVASFKNVQVDRNTKRREIEIPQDAILFASVGELTNRKNHRIMVQALSKLKNKQLHYIVVGDGELLTELRTLVENLQISDQVHFLGYRSDVAELYKASDVACLPSIQEGLPVALMEAMACGLPAICSKIRGNSDLLDDNGGILFDPLSIDDCVKSILAIIDADREKMGQYNLKKIQNYSLENIMIRMYDIYG